MSQPSTYVLTVVSIPGSPSFRSTNVPDSHDFSSSAPYGYSRVFLLSPEDSVTSVIIRSDYLKSTSVSNTTKTSPSKESPVVPSDSECLRVLRSSDISRYFPSDSNVPWFESLFPGPVPTITDSTLEKDAFNTLFKTVASQAKIVIKEKTSYSFSHLPRSLAAAIQKTILSSVTKSTASKCPQAIIKKAQHLSPVSKQSKASPKEATPPSKKVKAPAAPESPKDLHTPKVNSKSSSPTKKAIPSKTSKSSDPSHPATNSSPVTVSQVIQALHESSNPAFYFAADKTPTFKTLFPGTTMPRHTHVSGNIRIEKQSFAPLLTTRIKQAHTYLRARNMQVTKLPAAFLKYQTRLICRSVEKTKSDVQASRTKKREVKTAAKKVVEFIPQQSKPLPKSQQDSPSQSDPSDAVYDLRQFRSQLQVLVAESALPPSLINPKIISTVLANPQMSQFLIPNSDSSSEYSPEYYKVPDPDRSCRAIAFAKKILPVVVARTSLTYEHAFV